MKKKIFICLCLMLLFTSGCGCNKKEKPKSTKQELGFDVNFNISKEVEVNGLKISNISLIVEENGISRYSAIVTNNNDQVYKLKTIDIILKNEDGNTIEKIPTYIGPELGPDQSTNLSFTTDKDLLNVHSIEYEIKK